ncbi:MAG: PAS domain S-box protein [Verrucomicrobiales bacterium]|nr:PAS domain S-box protein [Verrucomicrobiales bacterium]
MSKPVRILYLEDSRRDAELTRDQFERAGLSFELRVVSSRLAYEESLEGAIFDLILSDFSLPGYDGIAALARARTRQPSVPFILISGTLGEEQAVDCMLRGATDYVLKQRLDRLVPAAKRALAEAEEQRARRRAEVALRQSEATFRAMFEVASIGMAQTDPQTGRLVRVNRKYCEITGYSEEELLQKRASEIIHPEDRRMDWDLFQRVVRGELKDYHIEKRYLRKDGSLAWVNVNLTVIRDDSGHPASTLATIEDITQRKSAEEERARLVAAIEQAAETVVITDTNARIVYANPAFERTSGFNRQEVLGCNPRILRSGKHDAEFYRKLWNTLSRGEVWHGNLVNRRKDGTLYEEAATISPVRDAAGKTVNYVAIKLDVTRMKDLEAQFLQSQKLEAFGQLAGGIAHDFHNILASMMLNLELLRANPRLDAETQQGLEELEASARRAAALTRQLLVFSRRSVLALVPQRINDVIANLLKMLTRLIGEHIELNFQEGVALPAVQADAGMLEQVLVNLVVNSRDAMPGGGRIIIRTTDEQIETEEIHPNAGRRAGRFVCISVADTGCGMTAETLSHVFEPFFTTKELGKGTGLGLATVHGIVTQHQGWVEVESSVGHGSTFRVYLPALDREIATAKVEESSSSNPRGDETILVVEDEVGVRRPVVRLLRRLGYQVHEAGNGKEAMEIWQAHGDQVSLLLTDMVMPEGMTGLELASRLQAQKPSLKAIISSGYSADFLHNQVTEVPGIVCLAKPYGTSLLAQTVRACLDQPG